MKNPKARAFLGELEKLDRMYENKLAERAHLRELATSVTAPMGGERVQRSSNPHKMAEAIEKSVDLEPEITAALAAVIAKRKEIIQRIERLKADEYDVLHKVYVQHLTFKEIAAKRGKSESWATTVHGRALKNLEAILEQEGWRENEISV